jgi:hypothetical protein
MPAGWNTIKEQERVLGAMLGDDQGWVITYLLLDHRGNLQVQAPDRRSTGAAIPIAVAVIPLPT